MDNKTNNTGANADTKPYLILLGDKERKLVAKAVARMPEITGLDGYWKLRAHVRKPTKAGGIGIYDTQCKALGASTWKAWPMPSDGKEPPLKKGQEIDADPYGGTVKSDGWTKAMAEYAEYVAARKAEKERAEAEAKAAAAAGPAAVADATAATPKPAPAPAPLPTVTAVEQKAAAAVPQGMAQLRAAVKAAIAEETKKYLAAISARLDALIK